MSPEAMLAAYLKYRFPRVSGDEPYIFVTDSHGHTFSPRERG